MSSSSSCLRLGLAVAFLVLAVTGAADGVHRVHRRHHSHGHRNQKGHHASASIQHKKAQAPPMPLGQAMRFREKASELRWSSSSPSSSSSSKGGSSSPQSSPSSSSSSKGGSSSPGSSSGGTPAAGASSGGGPFTHVEYEPTGAPNPAGGGSSPVDWPLKINGAMPPAQFVPFGKHIPRKPGIMYFVATGKQECRVCRRIIEWAYDMGRTYPDLCGDETSTYQPMCVAQAKILQACPEFVNDWCYQDFGGTQVLKSPCPDLLTCHYCLGLNPIHCIDSIEEARESSKMTK